MFAVILLSFAFLLFVYQGWKVLELTQEVRYRNQLIAWERSKFPVINEALSNARVMASVPHRDSVNPGILGMPNHILVAMMEVILEQEKIRGEAATPFKRAMLVLSEWETRHPMPVGPTYFFGRYPKSRARSRRFMQERGVVDFGRRDPDGSNPDAKQ